MQPAEMLEGLTLPGNWMVLQKAPRKPTATGGHFSVGYIVQNAEGLKGFLKAMDYTAAFMNHEPHVVLQQMTNAYNFEKNVCAKCRNFDLRRVVHAIGSGTFQVDPRSVFSKVEYLIFELAEGDIRAHLDAQAIFDVAFALRTLHNIATGLAQLHQAEIAHQDLKPSNVLVFQKDSGSKIGDFGRAWAKDFPAPHDGLPVAGDLGYAPLELLYGDVATEVKKRRYGCDAYHLGSMAVFLFTRSHMNALINTFLAIEHRAFIWGGTFAEVLPYLQAAFAQALCAFGAHICESLRSELTQVVAELCEPDPARRGHPLNRQGHLNQFCLHRYISKFNLLAYRVELNLIGSK